MARDTSIRYMAGATGSTMRRLLSSLQFRLVVGFALILSAALISVGWYVSAQSSRQAEQSEALRLEVRAERARAFLAQHVADRRGWADVQPTIEELGTLLGTRILVRDADGRIVGDSHQRWGPPVLPALGSRAAPPIQLDGARVGSVDLLAARPVAEEQRPEPAETELADRVNATLMWAGIAAGGAGILAVGLMSRRALAPVRALSAAAERLGRGDLSQRVRPSTQDEIGRLGATFNRMATELDHAEQQRRELLAGIAHELRTPLSNIGGYVLALRDGLLEPRDETFDIVQQQVTQLTRLVEDLRLLTLTESGALHLHVQPESIGDLLRSVVDAFSPRAAARSISLTHDGTAHAPPVLMDRGRTEQILHNLVENAVTHTPDGGAITLAAGTRERGRVRVSVANTGPGIPGDALNAVFQRFYRLDSSRSRTTGGAGLGLTIAKQLVEAQGGRIWAESEPERGSTFIFELPLSDSPARTAEAGSG